MGRKFFAVAVFAVAVSFAISGCGTVPKKLKEEVSSIKTKVDTLESRVETVESKQMEVEKTTAEQGQTIEAIKATKEPSAPKSNVGILNRNLTPKEKTKDIQTALKKAGFYDGKIDGIKGEQTKKAIKAFQKANGLRDDGVVGPKTWDMLGKYMSSDAPAKSNAGGTSESAE